MAFVFSLPSAQHTQSKNKNQLASHDDILGARCIINGSAQSDLDFETDCREWRTWRLYKVTRQDFFFRISGTSFHSFSLLTFFLCFIVLFQSCCSLHRFFVKTLVREFPISYSHTEWNWLSSGTNTLLWWRACYQKLNYKQTVRSRYVRMCITSCQLVQFVFRTCVCISP